MVKMNVIEFVVKEIAKKDIVLAIDKEGKWLHKKWCQLTYYDHWKGCPRFDKCKDEPLLFDMGKEPFIIVGVICDFKKYLEDMNLIHNDWSDRRLRTNIYWQRHIDKVLRLSTEKIISDYEFKGFHNLGYTVRPEIHGVFVIATMLRLGYEIELKPNNVLWKINLIYNRISENGQKKIMAFF